ncbi:hypothetical protein [Bacillus pseudomycoides]|uniref:hypothetical protein n=1 Tax=Bacillus pseudomycoides TaxID=64104 RepID=UPI0023DA007B|nr:hypothetical protein [Bacillus pseudomycoides]MDF2083823.1 hypothetical protein [Bacillus pseudomycoides]
MTNLKVTIEVIENKGDRDNLVERVEVLERVKELLLLPNVEMATTSQVAEFYGVKVKAISNLLADHTDELKLDGYKNINGKELASAFKRDTKIEYKRGYILVNDLFKLSHRPMGVFPKRAILRVGMLLRDSEVAKEVRTQLLNIEENSTQEVKTQEIDHEMTLEMNIGRAISKGDYVAVLSEAGLTRTFISASNELSLLR